MSGILDKVNLPADLKGLSLDELNQLAAEVRVLIIETVSKTGGHLASNLGVVELTIAMLKVFDPPDDKFLWDVSHQSYAYKILTGRKNRFDTLRQKDGISGFSKRSESEYDAFGAGHSGTSVSAGLGMAVARDRRGSNEHVVAVLGDGSAGNGIAYEAMINVYAATKKFIIVLNDNEMSIAANVGSMSRYLGSLLASPRYNHWKRSVENVATRMKMGWLRSVYYRIEESIKGLFLRSVIFEEFGLRYVGPIDGHDMSSLIDALTVAKESDRPILLHVATKKGKGFLPAEEHPEKWHGVSAFNPVNGELRSKGGSKSYSGAFGSTMLRLTEMDDKVLAITAAMSMGTGLSAFSERFPSKFFDVGISEEHAVVFACGLAAEGFKPVFAVYSTFIQRSVDYVIHDMCLQKLPVVLCLDRAGVVGDDGPTHHGVFDIALLRPVPGLVIMQPKDEAELANMLFTSTKLGQPVVIRYPRGSSPGVEEPDELVEMELGRAEVLCDVENATAAANRVWLWALGDMIPLAESSAVVLRKSGFEVGVVNARFVQPLDEELLAKHVGSSAAIVTFENGVVKGGFGGGIDEWVSEHQLSCKVIKFGWPDEFIPQGKQDELMQQYGLTAEAVAARVMDVCRDVV